MKLTLLGTGGPIPDPARHGSAAVLEIGGTRLLFDAGRGVVLQLARAGIPVEEVGPVFLTHHHYDHIGDLADVILTGWLQGRRSPLRVVGPPGTESIVTALLERVYDRDIAFRSQGEHAIEWAPVESADVTSGAGPGTAAPGGSSPSRGARSRARLPRGLQAPMGVSRLPGRGGGQGRRFQRGRVACEGLDRLALDADVLVQCCYMARAELTTPYFARLARRPSPARTAWAGSPGRPA